MPNEREIDEALFYLREARVALEEEEARGTLHITLEHIIENLKQAEEFLRG